MPVTLSRRAAVAAACAGLFALRAGATPAAGGPAAAVGDALARPAVLVRKPAAAVLLSAAMAGRRVVAVGERGLVAVSDDGGRQWRQAPCPVSVTLTTVRFADERRGVAVGHGGTVLATDDAGDSWQLRLDGRSVGRLALAAAKAAGKPAAVAEAERLVADGPDKPFLDLLLWDAQRLLAVGAFGIAFASSDGGRTWQPWMDRLPNPQGLHLYVARRSGSALLLAGEQGLLLRSDDDGASFKRLASPYKGSWFTADMPSSDELVLAGLRGNAWRSADGGQSFQPLASPMPATLTASLRTDDGLLFVNQAGRLLRLQGDALVPLKTEPLPPLAGLVQVPGGPLIVLGLTGPVPLPAAAAGAATSPAATSTVPPAAR